MTNEAEEFKRRYLGFHVKLYNIAFSLTRNKEMAEDAVQDCYLKLWQKRKEVNQFSCVEGYCVTLVRNRCIDLLRLASAKHKPVSIAKVDHEVQQSMENDRNEERETMYEVLQVMDRLPDNQQKVLRLQAISQCSVKEIERITGFSNTNIRSYLSRGRKQLRKHFLNKKMKGGEEI